jgi:hypothetical protein
MAIEIEFHSKLRTERLGNRLWVLTSDFTFIVGNDAYTAKRGFVTDGASNIRLLWAICAPVAGPFGEMAVAHDLFYCDDGPDVGRLYADYLLYLGGRMRGANILQAQAVKTGVNLFGWRHYKKGKEKVTPDACYDYDYAVKAVKFYQETEVGFFAQ